MKKCGCVMGIYNSQHASLRSIRSQMFPSSRMQVRPNSSSAAMALIKYKHHFFKL